MAKKIITVSREFGSGGRSIAKMVAENLGFSYYDKEIIEKVAESTGFDEKYIEEKGEYAPAKHRFAYSFVGRSIDGISAEDYIWAVQRKFIWNIAKEENCVIVGRCADYILREKKDALHVFIHADMQNRSERIVRLYGQTDEAPEKRLMDKDRKRQLNYKYYTERDWGKAQNYHIALDSGVIGIEECAHIITKIALK